MNKRMAILAGALIVVLASIIVILKHKSPQRDSAEQELIISSIIPLTGTAAEFGGYHREAVELFVDIYNNSHKGVRRVRHVFQDSKSTPKDGASAAQAIFLGDRPVAMQVQLSGVAMAVAPIAAENNLLLFTVAGTDGPKGTHKFAFRNYPSPETTAEETAKTFLANKPDVKVAILRINDEFGLSVSRAFKRRLDQMKIPVVAEETFEKSAIDFRAPVTKVLGANPSSVYLVGFGNPMGRIIVQLRELGYKGEILGGPEIAFADVLGVAKDAAKGVKFLDLAFSAESQNEPTRSFVERYQSRFNRKPTAVSGVVYDGWSLILNAIDKSGSTETERVSTELLKTTDYPGVCGKLRVSKDRDVVYPLVARSIRDGKPVLD